MKDYIQSAAIVICVGILCGAALYSCGRATNAYYQAQATCVQSGGTWVPIGGTGDYAAACVGGVR